MIVRRPLVLLYHRVAQLDDDPWQLAVTPRHFEQQLRVLKTFFRIVPLTQLVEDAQNGTVAITFDDGYADNLTIAAPILERHHAPATFFIATEPIRSQREFWWDELAQHATEYATEWAAMKRMSGDAREHAFASHTRVTRESHRPMTMDDLRRLASRRGVSIGSHGRTHACLAALDRDEQHREIAGSRAELQEWLQRDIDTFAYPFGRDEDYSAETVDVVREAGYRYAFRSGADVVRRGVDPLQVPRCYVRDWNAARFGRELLRWLNRADAAG